MARQKCTCVYLMERQKCTFKWQDKSVRLNWKTKVYV